MAPPGLIASFKKQVEAITRFCLVLIGAPILTQSGAKDPTIVMHDLITALLYYRNVLHVEIAFEEYSETTTSPGCYCLHTLNIF